MAKRSKASLRQRNASGAAQRGKRTVVEQRARTGADGTHSDAVEERVASPDESHRRDQPFQASRRSGVTSAVWPTISLVTPNFNGEAFLRETLESVLSQRYPSLQYVLIDGASTDRSLEIARAYEDGLDAIVSESDLGHADALNKGFRRTTGEIMGWINSDDVLLPGSLATIGALFATHPEIRWITGKQGVILETGERAPSMLPRRFTRHDFLRGDFMWIQQESTFWRRSLWDQAGGHIPTEFTLANDFELWMRFFRHERLVTVEADLGAFRRRPGQRSQVFADRYFEEIEKIRRRESMLDGLADVGPTGAVSSLSILRKVDRRVRRTLRSWAKRLGLSVYACDLRERRVKTIAATFAASMRQERP
jgi:glycosyltransferase involved in cell wall biosynthesis